MDLSLVILGFLVFLVISFVTYRALIQRQVIIEQGKLQRSLANAQERSSQKKMDGLFEMQLAKIAASGAPDSEFSQLLELIGTMKQMKAGAGEGQQGISWDVMKEQLKNPEVKKLILEHQDEVRKIIQEK